MVSRTLFRRSIAAYFALAGCGSGRDAHRFTDVVGSKASPDGALAATLVWSEHGPGKPHLSAVVLAATGADPLDGDPVVVASEDYRPLDYRWTEASTLEVRLPCGAWSSLSNQWHVPQSRRVVVVDYLPPQRCLAKTPGSTLPAGASQPAGVMFSPA